jgi:hypothetical protein
MVRTRKEGPGMVSTGKVGPEVVIEVPQSRTARERAMTKSSQVESSRVKVSQVKSSSGTAREGSFSCGEPGAVDSERHGRGRELVRAGREEVCRVCEANILENLPRHQGWGPMEGEANMNKQPSERPHIRRRPPLAGGCPSLGTRVPLPW